MDKLIWYDSDGRINCRRGYEVALARLASYEATGMMPDEIVRMGMAYEDSKRYSGRLELKLMPHLNIGLSPDELKALMLASAGTCVAEIKAFDGVAVDRLCDLAEADKDGRVVVLPCKVGDTVYTLFCGEVVEKRIGQFHVNGYTSPRIWADLDCDFMSTKRVRWDLSVGKDFFLAKAEAEKALEAQRND